MPTVHVIVVAAGRGTRFGAPLPKQFCLLGGRPVLMTTIERMRRALPEGRMVLVLSEDMVGYWLEQCRKYGFESPGIAPGGATRWESVKNALNGIESAPGDMIMIHDGARPLVVKSVVEALTEAVGKSGRGAVPVVSVNDSMRVILSDGLSESVDRSRYCLVQTPQAFPADLLKEAYARPYSELFTDDASVVESAFGHPVELVEGSALTLKITHSSDLAAAENLLSTDPV